MYQYLWQYFREKIMLQLNVKIKDKGNFYLLIFENVFGVDLIKDYGINYILFFKDIFF